MIVTLFSLLLIAWVHALTFVFVCFLLEYVSTKIFDHYSIPEYSNTWCTWLNNNLLIWKLLERLEDELQREVAVACYSLSLAYAHTRSIKMCVSCQPWTPTLTWLHQKQTSVWNKIVTDVEFVREKKNGTALQNVLECTTGGGGITD